MSMLLKVLGFIWASPLTLACLTYVSVFWALGWYKYHGIERDALVFCPVPDRVKGPLKAYWDRWGGHCIGNVIVADADPADTAKWDRLLTHEGQHVKQVMRAGIFWALMYGLNALFIWLCCPSSHYYWSNPCEIDARRAAGQLIDVEGVKQRLQEKSRTRSS